MTRIRKRAVTTQLLATLCVDGLYADDGGQLWTRCPYGTVENGNGFGDGIHTGDGAGHGFGDGLIGQGRGSEAFQRADGEASGRTPRGMQTYIV